MSLKFFEFLSKKKCPFLLLRRQILPLMHADKSEFGYFVNVLISSFITSPSLNSIWIKSSLPFIFFSFS